MPTPSATPRRIAMRWTASALEIVGYLLLGDGLLEALRDQVGRLERANDACIRQIFDPFAEADKRW